MSRNYLVTPQGGGNLYWRGASGRVGIICNAGACGRAS